MTFRMSIEKMHKIKNHKLSILSTPLWSSFFLIKYVAIERKTKLIHIFSKHVLFIPINILMQFYRRDLGKDRVEQKIKMYKLRNRDVYVKLCNEVLSCTVGGCLSFVEGVPSNRKKGGIANGYI